MSTIQQLTWQLRSNTLAFENGRVVIIPSMLQTATPKTRAVVQKRADEINQIISQDGLHPASLEELKAIFDDMENKKIKPILYLYTIDKGATFTGKAPICGQIGNPPGEIVYTEADFPRLRKRHYLRITYYIDWLGGWRPTRSKWDDSWNLAPAK